MSILLGFLDSKIKDEFTNELYKVNKIGGHLCISSSIKDQELNDLKSFSICNKCNERMVFIGQINCPLEGDNYDRYLYMFACNTVKCGQWSIIRYMQDEELKETESNSKNKQKIEEKNNWLNDQDEWGNLDESFKKEEINLDNEKNNLNKVTNLNNQEYNQINNQFIVLNEDIENFIQPYYLKVELEDQTEDLIKLDSHINKLLKNYKEKNKDKKDLASPNDEYSKIDETDILENYNNDVLTYKFYKKLSLAPGQVIRYSWNHQPLVNSSSVNLDELCCLILCENCGSNKVFEFQLMPALINYLKSKGNNQSLNLEFATVLIFTCKKNCSDKMLTKESYLVLEENDAQNLPEEFLK